MLKVVTSRLTRQRSRYALVVVCVAVCAAFMTAALGLASTLSTSLASNLAAPYKNADAVVTSPDAEKAPATADAQQISKIEQLTQVDSAWAPQSTLARVEGSSSASGPAMTLVSDLPSETSLLPTSVSEGKLPETPQQIVTTEKMADELHAGVGDTVVLGQAGDDNGGTAQYTLSGVTQNASSSSLPDWYATSAGLERIPGQTPGVASDQQAILLRTHGTLDQEQLGSLAAEVNRILGTGQAGQPALDVKTPEQMADDSLQQMSQGTDVMAIFLGLFAGISVLVALLVVTNTLSVLTAQRARELALLRCVGATGSQLRRAVLLEGLFIGVLASALGVAAVAGLVALLNVSGLAGALTLTLAPRDMLVGFVTGVLLTVIASLGPARRARGASALDGLRGSRAADGMPVVRVVLGALVLVAGATALVLGATQHSAGFGIAGGLASFLGVVLTSRAYIPGLVRGAGKLLPGGIPSRLAAANAARYPTRTSTTATALLIGVLLVSTVLTGQHVARTTLLDQLDHDRPVDISVPANAGQLSHQQVTDLQNLPDVAGVQTDGSLPAGSSAAVDAVQYLDVQKAGDLQKSVADILHVDSSQLGGALMEKAGYVSILDILLTVVLGLLAVAVVVSVLGIASTTSLSVLERSQENSLLRALGLSKRQLGALIRREALVISLVATVVGLVVGWLFGVLGVMAVLPDSFAVQPVVPWAGFLLILAGAVVVAVLASALPVRRATKLSPVQGMARAD
ncbi:ABC transporter permease [Kocuria tytonicola]|uniref:FtsX-like permease family protein n=1 Tax=Kocuria tytonicola TaxID=2055946 RepID=A0A3L9LU92_9MICC|nr:ABC transporter permease [Kocuria tytonicola]RLY93752.1 FtsX-like permease family protein [Kocuria tytonicola]RLZ02546.1 ABC transporter permease [Kocuria tytonicola]